MKQHHQSVVLALLLAMALGLSGCASMRGGSDAGASGASGSSGMSGTGSSAAPSTGAGTSSGSSGSSGTTGTSGSGYDQAATSGAAGTSTGSATGTMSDTASGSSGAQGATSSGSAMASSASPNSTVVSIEMVPRPASGIGGTGSAAGAAIGSSAAGATGSSADRVYRVSLRMDDGSTQVVTQETTPDFRSGDRVSLSGGTIQH